MRHSTIFALLAIVSVCSAQFETIGQIISSDPSFSTLYSLVQATDLTSALNGNTLYTLFAPNNTAFQALPAATLKYLTDPQNKYILTNVLTYHLVSGALVSSNLANYGNSSISTIEGDTIDLSVRSPYSSNSPFIISLNDARVTKPNVLASNGVIHVIDQVLIDDLRLFVQPDNSLFDIISAMPELSTLKTVLKLTGLDQVLSDPAQGPFTLFAPTNDAFADPILNGLLAPSQLEALQNVLLYHVVSGTAYSVILGDGGIIYPLNAKDSVIGPLHVRRLNFPGKMTLRVGGATVLNADLTGRNGVLHTINRVLLPYSTYPY